MKHPIHVEVSEDLRESHPITVSDQKAAFSLRIEEAKALLALLPEAVRKAEAARKAA